MSPLKEAGLVALTPAPKKSEEGTNLFLTAPPPGPLSKISLEGWVSSPPEMSLGSLPVCPLKDQHMPLDSLKT